MVDAPKDHAISDFPIMSTIDTCAIWNILCSRILVAAAKEKKLVFILADYVRYECLSKPRKRLDSLDSELQDLLRSELLRGKHFITHSLDVSDLRELLAYRPDHKLFHSGELAALALAMKLRKGFVTDDRNARKMAEKAIGAERVRTTPHLVGWLVYTGRLMDGDILVIIQDNRKYRQTNGYIGDYIQACYEHAMGMRLSCR